MGVAKTLHIVTPGAIKELRDFQGDSVSDLRRAVAMLLHIDPASLRLVYNGAALEDSLGTCPVNNGGGLQTIAHAV